MDTLAFRMQLKPGVTAEYRRRHDQLWPELGDAARRRHLRLLDLPRRGDAASCSPCSSCGPATAATSFPQHPVMRRWWSYMAELMETEPDQRPREWPLVPMFHFD